MQLIVTAPNESQVTERDSGIMSNMRTGGQPRPVIGMHLFGKKTQRIVWFSSDF